MLFLSQTLFMLHHKVWSSQIRTTLCEEHSESPIRHRLKPPKFFVCFGLTDSSISVIPRSLSRSRFSISVQPIWTFRSHRVAVTDNNYASRCHRVVPLSHTDRVGLYILTGKILEISPKPLRPRIARSASWVSGSSSSSPAASYRWSPPPSTEFSPAIAAIVSSSPN